MDKPWRRDDNVVCAVCQRPADGHFHALDDEYYEAGQSEQPTPRVHELVSKVLAGIKREDWIE